MTEDIPKQNKASRLGMKDQRLTALQDNKSKNWQEGYRRTLSGPVLKLQKPNAQNFVKLASYTPKIIYLVKATFLEALTLESQISYIITTSNFLTKLCLFI